MSETEERKLYSPLQVDIIDRDHSNHAIPLQAASRERKEDYLVQIMNGFREVQPHVDAKNAFFPGYPWSGIEYPYEWSEVAAYLPRLTAKHLTLEELRACARRGHIWDHSDPKIQRLRAEMPKKRRTVTHDERGHHHWG